MNLKQISAFKILDNESLKLINAGGDPPDCDGGNRPRSRYNCDEPEVIHICPDTGEVMSS